MSEQVYVVSIEVDGRQAYIFETDRLREMLGASRLMQATVSESERLFQPQEGLFLFQPVSGEIRVWAEPGQKARLLERTWQLKVWLNDRGIEHTCGWSTASHSDLVEWAAAPDADKTRRDHDTARPNLSRLQRDLGVRVSALKGAKGGVDAHPSCSLFAPCEIHGHDFATEWRSGQGADIQDSRRNLRGARAASKLCEWEQAKAKLFEDGLYRPAEAIAARIERDTGKRPQRAIRLDDLSTAEIAEDGDQFVAFICADGDGLGELLQQIDWNSPALKPLGDAPWQVNYRFAKALDEAVNQAYGNALASVLDQEAIETALSGKLRLPMLPQLLGGDDLWTVCKRDAALPFCCEFARAFSQMVAADPTIAAVVKSTGRDIAELTISFGVAFAKAGHPAHAMIETAESLLRSAKALRKGQIAGRPKPAEGCIDWHWVDSSLIQSVNSARKSGLTYRAEGTVCSLTSKPWTVSQCERFLVAASRWAVIPRRKREQVESVLRRGPRLSSLAWESWAKSLKGTERRTLSQVFESLEAAGALPSSDDPVEKRTTWRVSDAGLRETPFIDLLSLDDVLGASGGQS